MGGADGVGGGACLLAIVVSVVRTMKCTSIE